MTDTPNPQEKVGWELIWRSGDIPPRYRSFSPPSTAVVDWAETLPSGGLILDVGCGVGRHLIYLGERGFRLAGVDISPSGIKMAQEVCAERQLTVDARVADMSSLPWAEATFDAAFSIATIHHHLRADILRTLAEVRRVLKPGGVLMADFPCVGTLAYEQVRAQLAAGEIKEVEPNTFVDDRPISDDSDAFLPHHFCDEVDLRALLKDFEIIKLWADLREVSTEQGSGKAGKWVVWACKPLSD